MARRNIHDSSLPVSVQCTSVRLLLNLVEVIFARRADQRAAEAYRALLTNILDAFTAKLGSLHRRLPRLLAHGARPGMRCHPSTVLLRTTLSMDKLSWAWLAHASRGWVSMRYS